MRGHIVAAGCAGFIGSHLADRLLANEHVADLIDMRTVGRFCATDQGLGAVPLYEENILTHTVESRYS